MFRQIAHIPWTLSLTLLVASCAEPDVEVGGPSARRQVFISRASDYEALLGRAFVDELNPILEEAPSEVGLAIRIAATTAASHWAQRLVQRLVLGENGTCTWTYAESTRPAYNSGSYMAELSPQLVSRVYVGRFTRGADGRIECVFQQRDGGTLSSPLEATFSEESGGELRAPPSMRDLPIPLAEPPLWLTLEQ